MVKVIIDGRYVLLIDIQRQINDVFRGYNIVLLLVERIKVFILRFRKILNKVLQDSSEKERLQNTRSGVERYF